MLVDTLMTIYNSELKKLRTEIESYQHEEALWKTDKNIANPAGNLCLHLVGNLNGFIGAELGHTGYVRNRDLEFSEKGLSKAELLQKIDDTITVVDSTLKKLTDEDLEKDFPRKIFAETKSAEYMLVYMLSHFTYHLGQVNYHRRLLD